MRVLHLFSGNLYGGIEAVLVSCAAGRSALEQEFALCFEGRLAGELRAAGATVHPLGAVRFSRPWTVLRARARITALLDTGRFDAVICHAAWSQALFGSLASRRPEAFAYYSHDASLTMWTERLARLTRPDLALANSRYTLGQVSALFPQTPWEVLYYPVRTLPAPQGDRAQTRAGLGASPDAVVILQASRLERWKGQLLHLRALGLLRDEPRWVLWLAGGAQRPSEIAYAQELRAEVEKLGLSARVKFLGQRSDIPALLAAADVFCQPNSGPEPFGVAFIEALQAGRPVVSTALGGAAEILTPACAELCDPTPESVAGGLRRMIGDPDRRAHASAAAPQRARELTDAAAQLGKLGRLLSTAAVAKSSRRAA